MKQARNRPLSRGRKPGQVSGPVCGLEFGPWLGQSSRSSSSGNSCGSKSSGNIRRGEQWSIGEDLEVASGFFHAVNCAVHVFASGDKSIYERMAVFVPAFVCIWDLVHGRRNLSPVRKCNTKQNQPLLQLLLLRLLLLLLL